MMDDTYDPARDSYESWSLAVRAIREQMVRAGLTKPLTTTEERQAAEGERPRAQLDCVRGAW